MSDSPSLIEDIYAGLKHDLLSGTHLPGERLDISDIVKRFRGSKTPILLALNRLVGEGLVEARPHDGYYIPRLTTDSLRELYECDYQILTMVLNKQLASDNRLESLSPISFTETDSVADTEALFMAIASLSSNREFGKIVSSHNDRLRPLRRLKANTAFNLSAELSSFKAAWGNADLGGLKILITDYHQRRLAHLPEFIALAYTAPVIRSSGGTPPSPA